MDIAKLHMEGREDILWLYKWDINGILKGVKTGININEYIKRFQKSRICYIMVNN